MSANPNTRAIDNPVEQNGGVVWNRLHSEREDICEALLKEPVAAFENEAATHRLSNENAQRPSNWHKELLQARLRKIDDALDRLMAGSYGNCRKCGKWIEDTKLDFDPAIEFCLGCWERERPQERTSLPGVALESLAPFETIWARTLNSEYRILLLDPHTGRALVEGGHQFVEPVEAVVNGSTFSNSTFKVGWIGKGLRIEFWTNGLIVSTSPVQSVRVEHHASAEPALVSMSAVH
jgi:RNA polymerase-binding transcription factor DksA